MPWCAGYALKIRCIRLQLVLCSLIICAFLSSGLEAAAENFLSRWDRVLFDSIYDAPPRQEPMWGVMEGVSRLGDYRGVMGTSILLMAYGGESHRETGRLLSSAYMGAGLLTFGMKRVVRRKRPLDDTLGNPAFPSGHAALAFSVVTILGYRYPKWRIPLYVGAGLVSFSRVYLGRHYTSDVVVGAAIGTVTGVLVWRHRVTLLKWEF